MIQKETKNEVMACYNAWRDEKGQRTLCSEQMKVQVTESAIKICENPSDKNELKKNKKKIARLFNYLESEDKESEDPYELAQLIDAFK